LSLPPSLRGALRLPLSTAGMRIGILGGSFNPPHEGHRLVAEQCLKRLHLDAVWIVVTPGNPLKSVSELAPLSQRIEQAAAVFDHPRIRITAFEAQHGFRYTWQTLQHLRRAVPTAGFVWLMGADNMRSFHRWKRWQLIASLMPMAVYARPGSTLLATTSPAATTLRRFRLPEAAAPRLASLRAPAWLILHGMQSAQSSSALRAWRHSSN
jgi:nicotinate-nucleotide adenylyltransferase